MTTTPIPQGWEKLDITARDLETGDLYWTDGYMFQADEVLYDQPGNRAEATRTTWTAVWLGAGEVPPSGWHRFGSGGNQYRRMTVLRLTHPYCENSECGNELTFDDIQAGDGIRSYCAEAVESAVCGYCFESGHVADDCPTWTPSPCGFCFERGHDLAACPEAS